MTTFGFRSKTCAVCGTTTSFSVINSTNAFGSPDLDLRPPEMKRSTMSMWVHQCPECGYAAADIEEKPSFDRSFLETEAYRTYDGLKLENWTAQRFYHNYQCAAKEGDEVTASMALLRAAWCCDDDGEAELARKLRKMSVEIIDSYFPKLDEGERKDTLRLIRADMLRRSRQFERLGKEYSPDQFEEGVLRQVAAFELKLAAAGDDKGYRVVEAVNDEDGGSQEHR